MGYIEGSKIHWTHLSTTAPVHDFIWYCQQHRDFGIDSSATLGNAFTKLKPHFETIHGNVEQ